MILEQQPRSGPWEVQNKAIGNVVVELSSFPPLFSFTSSFPATP
jgi:hypothetical protein